MLASNPSNEIVLSVVNPAPHAKTHVYGELSGGDVFCWTVEKSIHDPNLW